MITKRISLLLLLMGLISCLMSCSKEDDNRVDADSRLFQHWVMTGYGNDQEFHPGDGPDEKMYAEITFYSDGTFDGFVLPNKRSGKYVCYENQIRILTYEGHLVASDDPVYRHIGKYISQVYSYLLVTDTELRLYYMGDNYFRFKSI